MIDGLGAVLPLDPSALTAVRLDGRAVPFTIALVAAVTAICGLVPALRNSSTALRAGLDDGARVTGPDRLRRAFVVVQVSLAVTLGTAGVLMGRTTLALGATPRGYDEPAQGAGRPRGAGSDTPPSGETAGRRRTDAHRCRPGARTCRRARVRSGARVADVRRHRVDPATLLGIATAAVATTLLAVWLPARHAASIDPAAVLRGE